MTHFKTRLGTLPIFSDLELQCLTMPVLLLVGERDVLRDAEKISARMQKLVPYLTTIIIPKGGHALLNTTAHILPFLIP
jgi:pimeloyl-ACP methyl ester carboxylesterase